MRALLGRSGHIAFEVHDNDPNIGDERWAGPQHADGEISGCADFFRPGEKIDLSEGGDRRRRGWAAMGDGMIDWARLWHCLSARTTSRSNTMSPMTGTRARVGRFRSSIA